MGFEKAVQTSSKLALSKQSPLLSYIENKLAENFPASKKDDRNASFTAVYLVLVSRSIRFIPRNVSNEPYRNRKATVAELYQ